MKSFIMEVKDLPTQQPKTVVTNDLQMPGTKHQQ